MKQTPSAPWAKHGFCTPKGIRSRAEGVLPLPVCTNLKFFGEAISGSGFEDIIFQSIRQFKRGGIWFSLYSILNSSFSTYRGAFWMIAFRKFLDNGWRISKSYRRRLTLSWCERVFWRTCWRWKHTRNARSFYEVSWWHAKWMYGKTSQFWILYYLNVMWNQHLLHFAVQKNNFLRLHGLKRALLLMFALNNQNYARNSGKTR